MLNFPQIKKKIATQLLSLEEREKNERERNQERKRRKYSKMIWEEKCVRRPWILTQSFLK